MPILIKTALKTMIL